MNNEQQCARRVFVIGTAVESVYDLRLLNSDRVIRRALDDAGLKDEQLIRAVCVDRAMKDATSSSRLDVPTFEVQNASLNGGKTLLLARQLITLGGAGCVLALGLDRHRLTAAAVTASRPVRVQPSVDTRPLIVEFGRVQRRNVDFAQEEVWQQTEQFQESWCHDDVIVACVLASEATVQRLQLHERAMEIVDMEVAFAEEFRRRGLATERHATRMISTLGFDAADAPPVSTDGMQRTGLVHCAITSQMLRGSPNAGEEKRHRESSSEILLAQYGRCTLPIKAKL